MRRRRASRAAELVHLVPLVDRVVDQRWSAAAQSVAALRAEQPTAAPDELADALIRRCSRELALGGAVAGGTAASPVAGIGLLATTGADATWSLGRLSELVMAIGLVYGHDHAGARERAGWVWAVLGLSDGAAAGLTGLAARVGSRGGARLLARLPASSQARVSSRLSSRVLARLGATKGPWSLAALVPYGIGAGVGAAGNLVLAQSVGRAAKQFFGAQPPPTGPTLVEDAGWGELVDDDVTDAEVVDEDIVDAEVVDDDAVDVEVVDPGGPAPPPPG